MPFSKKSALGTGLENLTDFLLAMNSSPIPESAEIASRYCLLDTLGVGLYGSTCPEARSLINGLERIGSSSDAATIWGTQQHTGIEQAAFICGSLCHLRELDDVHYTILHSGAVCVPTAIATAEKSGATLGQLLLAIATGVEAMVRISKGMDYMEHRQRGWHGTATCGAFGAAATTASLLGLDREAFINALGLSGSRTGGTWAFAMDGAISKRLHTGLAARDGLLSAYLAEQGLRGPHFLLEAEDGGFYKVFSGQWRLEELTKPSSHWCIEEVEYKWFASCKSVHASISAAQKIYRRNLDQNPEEIEDILVEVNKSSLSMAGKMYQKGSVITAQLSIPYGVALGLYGYSGQAQDYENDCLTNDRIYSLARKVRVIQNERMDALRNNEHKTGAIVSVRWKGGNKDSAEEQNPKGSLGNPLTARDLQTKYMNMTQRVLGTERCNELMELVLHGQKDMTVKNLVSYLIPGKIERSK